MNKKEKKEQIISCFGHVNQKSTARMCGVTVHYVSDLWAGAGLLYKRRNDYTGDYR